jgi:hypothetical protein
MKDGIQISCNLIDPSLVTPADAFDAIYAQFDWRAHIVRCELVGTIPEQVLNKIDPERWESLDLSPEATLEARFRAKGIAIA